MKTFLIASFGALVAFSVAMVATRERDEKPGVTLLTWVTDLNPQRAEQVALFGKTHPGLAIRTDPGNYDAQKVIVQSQAGVGPEVFDYWGPANFQAYVKSGIAWDITDELKRRGIDYKATVWPLALPWTVTEDGRVYGVPANVGLDGIWFHKDMFDAEGVPYPKAPWRIADIVSIAKRMTHKGRDGRTDRYGLLIDFGGGYREFLPSFGGALFSPDGKRCTVAAPESVACLQWMHDLIYVHHVSPSPNDEQSLTTGGSWGGTAGPQAYFRRRFGAMALGGRWWLSQLRDDIRDKHFRLGATMPPVATYPRFGNGGTRATMVNRLSPHREQALEFLLYELGADYSTLLNDQGDALAGVKAASYTERYIDNPRDPGEDFHKPFRDTLEMAVELPATPYLSATDVDLYLNRQLDLVKLDQKTPAQGMRDAARDIDDAIRKNVARDPDLQKRWDGR